MGEAGAEIAWLTISIVKGFGHATVARLDAPGVLHHVIGRGIERKEIFLGVKDRNDLLGRLAELVKNHAMDIYAWALLPTP